MVKFIALPFFFDLIFFKKIRCGISNYLTFEIQKNLKKHRSFDLERFFVNLTHK